MVIWPSLVPIWYHRAYELISNGLHASKLETFIWILAITINLHVIFCVVFLWLKFQTHPSFLHNLKMANKLNYPLFCIKGGTRLVNAAHTRTISSSKSFIFKGITELKILNRWTLSIALSTWKICSYITIQLDSWASAQSYRL